jgi:hypothetical protein
MARTTAKLIDIATNLGVRILSLLSEERGRFLEQGS